MGSIVRSHGGIGSRRSRSHGALSGAPPADDHEDEALGLERREEACERAVRGAHDAMLTGRYAQARRMLEVVLADRPRDRSVRAAYHLAAGYEAKWAGRQRESRWHFKALLLLEKK